MNTQLPLYQRCRVIKRKASAILRLQEMPGRGEMRPAARRAWNFANNLQNQIILAESKGATIQ